MRARSWASPRSGTSARAGRASTWTRRCARSPRRAERRRVVHASAGGVAVNTVRDTGLSVLSHPPPDGLGHHRPITPVMRHIESPARQILHHPGAFALRVVKAFRANQGLLLAGAVAYYALLSI